MCDDIGKTLEVLDKIGQNDMTKGADLVARAAESSFVKMGKKVSDVEMRVSNLEKKFDVYSAESRGNFARLEGNQNNMSSQIQELADQVRDLRSLLLDVAKKDAEDDAKEEKAAQMTLLERFVSSTFGKVLIILTLISFIGLGVASIYIVDHSKEVSTLIEAAKK